jgi:hypothetical protein
MAFETNSRFIKLWHTASLSTILLPFLVFVSSLLLRIEEDIFGDASPALFLVYLITAGVNIKLMMIVHTLFSQGKLLPIRFLLNCFALYCLVIVIIVGYVPDVVRGDMFMDEFAEYNVQVGVLLFHTAFLSLVTSLGFSAWVTRMIRQRSEEGTGQVNGDLSDAMKVDINDDDIAKDTDYVQVL